MDSEWVAIILAVAVVLQMDVIVTDEEPGHNEDLESLYPGYKLVKETIEKSPRQMFKLKQSFVPAMNYRYWQVDGVEIIRIKICMLVYDNMGQSTTSCNMIEFGQDLILDFTKNSEILTKWNLLSSDESDRRCTASNGVCNCKCSLFRYS